MSLATALQELPDDRASRQATRHVLLHLCAHRCQPVEPEELSSATGIALPQVKTVLAALQRGFVVDCEPDVHSCVYAPTHAMATEVDRFLFTSERSHDKLRGNVERFRDSYTRRR